MADEPRRFSREEMLRLAASAVHKVDLLGPRGTTLCSMDEIDAMAGVCAISGLLPLGDCPQSPVGSALPGNAREVPGQPRGVNETPIFRSRRNKP